MSSRWSRRGSTRRAVLAFLLTSGALAAPGCTTTGTVSPGQDQAPGSVCSLPSVPAGCGSACTADALCGAGLHCEGGLCTAECWDGRPCLQQGFTCDARGRCIDPSTIPDGGPLDGDLADGDVCAEVSVTLDAVVPNVLFIVDRSGSMDEDFRGTDQDRWSVLREGLFAEPDPGNPGDLGGIVRELDGTVRFGMTLYTWLDRMEWDTCPLLVDESVRLGNYDSLRDAYDQNDPPGSGETPTGHSIQAVLASVPDDLQDPLLFVVATDGAPDRCPDDDHPNGQDQHDEGSQDLSVEAVQAAYTAGIETYMISLGPVGQRHMQDMANAGKGLRVKPRGEGAYVDGTDPMATWYDPEDNAGLRDALSTIVRGALSCELDVDGQLVVDRACEGTLFVDGVETPCDDPNGGWRAADENTIELLGGLCDALKAGDVETVEGRFPCEVILR